MAIRPSDQEQVSIRVMASFSDDEIVVLIPVKYWGYELIGQGIADAVSQILNDSKDH